MRLQLSQLFYLRAAQSIRRPQSTPVAAAKPPRLRTIARPEAGDESRGEVNCEAGVGPLLKPRRRRRKHRRHADEFDPREFHPQVSGEAEVAKRFRHLRQAQLRVSSGRGDSGRLLQSRFHGAFSFKFDVSGRCWANREPELQTVSRTRRSIAASRRTSSPRRPRSGRWDFR